MEHPVGKMKCFHPQTIKDNVVSCGRCPACKKNRINGWVCRLERHSRNQDSAHFITLTYAEGQAKRTEPKGKHKGLLTLDYTHVQHFLKTLRNLQNAEKKWKRRYNRHATKKGKRIRQPLRTTEKPISYYVAGEYGSKNKQTPRPHYHIILFNATTELIPRAWATGNQFGRISRGNVHQGNITGGSIRYTLKYISKPSRLPLFEGDNRTPEFSYMSKGIGKNYLTPKIIAWHKADILNRYYVPNAGGVQTTMPRYYANKIYTPAERIQIAEHLEKQSSYNFYQEVLQNPDIVRDFLLAQKKMERDALHKNQSLI